MKLEKILNSGKKVIAGTLLAGAMMLPLKADDFSDNSGVNYPNIHYSHTHTSWNDYHDGHSSGSGRHDMLLKNYDLKTEGAKLIRDFVLGDCRGEFETDDDGNITGPNPFTIQDSKIFLDAVKLHGMKSSLVLFDYRIADGISEENGFQIGEHPEYISDPVKKQQLLDNVLRPYLTEILSHDALHSIEVINEPALATEVSIDDMKSFITDIADLIHEISPTTKVTVGYQKIATVPTYDNASLDFVSVHQYAVNGDTLDTLASDISDKPVIIGETEPVDMATKIAKARANGYAGIMFWQDADHEFDGSLYKAIVFPNSDLEAPEAIITLNARDFVDGNYGSIQIDFNASEADDFEKFIIYRSDQPISDILNLTPYGETTDTFFKDTGVEYNTPYYYAVIAQDSSGNKHPLTIYNGPISTVEPRPPSSGGGGPGGCFINMLGGKDAR